MTALQKASNGICGIRRGHERGRQLDTSGPERRSGGLRRAGAAVPEAGVRPCGADVSHARAGRGGGAGGIPRRVAGPALFPGRFRLCHMALPADLQRLRGSSAEGKPPSGTIPGRGDRQRRGSGSRSHAGEGCGAAGAAPADRGGTANAVPGAPGGADPAGDPAAKLR